MSIIELVAVDEKEQWAREYLEEEVRPAQRDNRVCPRCGHRQKWDLTKQSSQVGLDICDTCALDEQSRDEAGRKPTPLTEWFAVKLLVDARKRA